MNILLKKKLSKTSKTPTFPACLQRGLNKNLIACFFRLWKFPDWLTRFKICCFWRVNYSWNAVCMKVVFLWVFLLSELFFHVGPRSNRNRSLWLDLYQLRSETNDVCLSDGRLRLSLKWNHRSKRGVVLRVSFSYKRRFSIVMSWCGKCHLKT